MAIDIRTRLRALGLHAGLDLERQHGLGEQRGDLLGLLGVSGFVLRALGVDALQLGEDGVIIVHALADLAVAEPLRVAEGAALFLAQILDPRAVEAALAGTQSPAR